MNVVCLNCMSPELALEKIQGDYDFENECYQESCPSCGASDAFAWADEVDN
jgi:hypothetical protein